MGGINFSLSAVIVPPGGRPCKRNMGPDKIFNSRAEVRGFLRGDNVCAQRKRKFTQRTPDDASAFV